MVSLILGNPLNCDCLSRPLKHFLNHLPKNESEDNIYSNIICTSPLTLKDSPFISVKDDRLNCIENVGNRKKLDKKNGFSNSITDYEIEADLVFRDVLL